MCVKRKENSADHGKRNFVVGMTQDSYPKLHMFTGPNYIYKLL